MFSDITSYFTSSSSQQDTKDDIELRKSWQIATSLADARTKKSAAESILQDKNMSRISPHDLCNLITRLLRSDESATDTHHNRELWKELPTYISILSAYPPDAELSSLPSEQATRIAANVTRAAALVKEKTEKYQAALCISLDHTTRGRFKAINSVDSESRRGQRIHTLMLTNLMFNDQALDALRRTLQNKQIVNLDLSNCFLGDHIVEGLLVNQLRGLPELAVLSLRANALTNDIVSLLITPRQAVTQNQHQQGNGDRKSKKKNKQRQEMQSMTTTTHSDVFHSLSNENTNKQRNNNHSSFNRNHENNNNNNNNSNNCPAFLESSNDFISLRLLILDDNEISAHHLNQIRVTLMMRWKRFVSQYDYAVAMGLSSIESRDSSSLSSLSNNNEASPPSSLPGTNDPPSSSFMFHNNNNNINHHNTTTCVSFRHSNLPSIFLSLDGSGVAGIMQAQYLANTPLFASQLPECIVATSASLITACAIALSIPMTTVCATFRKLATEVFQRSEWDAKHYAESAAMWVRKWWTCGDYYSSSKTLTILQGLFGNQKFMDLPGSRVIAVFDSSKGHVMIASSTPASPALQTQCHTFSSKPFAVAQYCPTVAEVCLASMAGPGHFAPRALNVPSTKYLNSIDNTNNIHQNHHQQNSILDPSILVDQVVVFDACGSMPNPSAVALTEAMRPSTKQRRLISISSESESGIASIPEHGVASIAASALSNWQNARVGLGNSELHGDFSNRCAAFVKLLKFGSYIARATSFSVQHIAESTEDNEAALREHLALVSKRNNRDNDDTDEDDSSSDDDETNNSKGNTSRKGSFSDEKKKNKKSPGIHPVPVHQHPSSSLQQQQQQDEQKEEQEETTEKDSDIKNNKNDDDDQQQQDEEATTTILRPVATEEEMKSISKLMLRENNNNDNNDNVVVENNTIGHHQKNNSETEEQDPFDFDAENDEKNKNKKRNKIRNSTNKNTNDSSNNFVSTAILYERIFPCTNDAPSIHYDENSMRILSVAQKQATYYNHEKENGLGVDKEEEREREQLRQPNRYYATTGVDSDNNNGAAAASSSSVIRGGRRN